MAYWWVNQKQTYRHEVPGKYMWSPKVQKNNRPSVNYDWMTQVMPGDVVFSYAGGEIKAVGVAMTDVQESPKPAEFGAAGRNWNDDGWLVEVAFHELATPLKPSSHMESLEALLPAKHSPIRPDGHGNQAYLFHAPEALALELARLIGPEFHGVVARAPVVSDVLPADDAEQALLEGRRDISPVERAQLIRARRGQGLFRIGVHVVEPRCRVTGVSDISMLIASHIKPWRKASDTEKLDPNNGLMLSPHVDHLFDDGLITFSGSGRMEISPRLDRDVLARWHIPEVLTVGSFNQDQRAYLSFHNDEIFLALA